MEDAAVKQIVVILFLSHLLNVVLAGADDDGECQSKSLNSHFRWSMSVDLGIFSLCIVQACLSQLKPGIALSKRLSSFWRGATMDAIFIDDNQDTHCCFAPLFQNHVYLQKMHPKNLARQIPLHQ